VPVEFPTACAATLPPPLTHRAIFDVLYTLLGYGHDSEASLQKLDPPDDFFRLRMVSGGRGGMGSTPMRVCSGRWARIGIMWIGVVHWCELVWGPWIAKLAKLAKHL
jgi:hypothetical protein